MLPLGMDAKREVYLDIVFTKWNNKIHYIYVNTAFSAQVYLKKYGIRWDEENWELKYFNITDQITK